jgi:hypothetical protein
MIVRAHQVAPRAPRVRRPAQPNLPRHHPDALHDNPGAVEAEVAASLAAASLAAGTRRRRTRLSLKCF